MSTQQLIKDGYTVHIDTSGAKVKWEGHTLLSAPFTNGSYVIHCTQQYTRKQAVKLHKTGVRSEELIHSRFGHASLPYLHRAGLTSSPVSYCIGCSSEKSASSSKGTSINPSTTTTYIATQPLEKLHMDTVGPFVLSIDQMKYFVTVVDQKMAKQKE